MKFKYWLIIAFCIVVSSGSIIYFCREDSNEYRHEYISTGKYIDGYEIYYVSSSSGPTGIRPVTVFATSEFKYTYTIGWVDDEPAVKVDDEYIPLSRFIFKYWITNEEIEESGIGRRTYWSDE